MPSREEQFKSFLQSLSDEKRQQLFNYLQKLSPDDRNKAIDTILKRMEAGNGTITNTGRVAKPVSQQKVSENNAKQTPRPVSNVSMVVKSMPSPKKEAPNKNQLNQNAPDSKTSTPSDDKVAANTTEKKASAPVDFASLKFNDAEPAKAPSKEVKSKAPVKTSKKVKASGRPVNTKRDLIVVFCILAIFTAICLGIKLYIGDDEENLSKTPETTITSEVTTTTVEETTTAVETSEVTETTEVTPSPTPMPTNVPLKENAPDLTGMVIVIDPGHQMETSSETENVASWKDSTKKKATSGVTGIATGIPEYELTLDVSIKLKDYLEQCGATVVLTRTENDVDISNQERAQIAVDNSANLFIRIHADAANDSMTSGVRVFVPDSGDYSSNVVAWGNSLGQKVADSVGLNFIGTKSTGLYTGLNYANSVPSFQISLGLLSNSDDEAVIVDENNQVEICAAIAEFAEEIK